MKENIQSETSQCLETFLQAVREVWLYETALGNERYCWVDTDSAYALPCCSHHKHPGTFFSHLLCMLEPGGRCRLPSPEGGPAWCCVPPVGVVQPTEATPLFLLSHVLMASQHDVVSGRSGNIFGKYLLIYDGSRGLDNTLLLLMYMVFTRTLSRSTSARVAQV